MAITMLQHKGVLVALCIALLMFSASEVAAKSTKPSAECTNAIDLTLLLLEDQDPYALAMFAGSGQYPGQLGNYDSCLAVPTAHYCVVNFTVPSDPGLLAKQAYRTGVCFPRNCTVEDVELFLPQWFAEFGFSKNISIHDTQCLENRELDSGALATVSFSSVLMALVVIAYTVHKLSQSKSSRHSAHMDARTGDSSAIENGYGTSTSMNSPPRDHSPVKAVLHTHANINSEQNGRVGEAEPLLGGGKGLTVSTPARKPSFGMRLLDCFNPVKNWKKLTAAAPGAYELRVFNGIRVLSIFWIILGHSLFFPSTYGGYDNVIWAYLFVVPSVAFQFISGAEFGVDTFFLMSGFLATYLMVVFLQKKQRKNDKFSKSGWVGLLYIHRYLRLTPLYGFVLLLFITLLSFLGNGPMWFSVVEYINLDSCRKYWWTNLLYIQNLYPHQFDSHTNPEGDYGRCMGWSWYLANDTQLYLLSPLFALLFMASKRIANVTVSVCTVVTMTIAIIISNEHDLTPCLLDPFLEVSYMKNFYTKPYTRAPPYLIGILLAFWYASALEKEEEHKPDALDMQHHGKKGHHHHTHAPRQHRLVEFSPLVRYGSAAVASAVLLGLIYMTAFLYEFPEASAPGPVKCDWGRVGNALYVGGSRGVFAMALAWLLLLVLNGDFKAFTNFFASNLFTPFARLTYGAYLIHPFVIYICIVSGNRQVDLTFQGVSSQFISNTVFTFVLSLVMYLVVECPFLNLEKMLFPSAR